LIDNHLSFPLLLFAKSKTIKGKISIDHKGCLPLFGGWITLASMNIAQKNFACVNGPDKDATKTLFGVDQDSWVYAIGENDINGAPLSLCEKYNLNTDT
jgi:hypothetical protein